MSEIKLPAASGGGSISIKGPASSSSDVDLLDTSGNLKLSDGDELRLGTGDDLKIYHDGSNGIIDNVNTLLIKHGNESMAKFIVDDAVELYFDNTKHFETCSDGLNFIGSNADQMQWQKANNLLKFRDGTKARFGEGGDLEVYHDGSNSIIDNNTGELKIQSDNFQFLTSDGSEKFADFDGNGAVELYHNNSKKFTTQSGGVQIDGNLTLYTGTSTQIHFYDVDTHTITLYTSSTHFRWWSEVDSDAIAEVQQDGDIRIDGSYLTGGVDYAEYFESTDGSAIPVGTTVVLDNGKVRAATGSETPIGVIRPKTSGTSVTGGTHDLNWAGKYLVDDYDGIVKENAIFCNWKEGDELKQSWKDRPPTGVTIPDDAVETTKSRKKLNPSFDASKTYVPRSEGVEWNCVGLLGQIPITKGQPTSTNWIKMKERSSTVELWMVK